MNGMTASVTKLLDKDRLSHTGYVAMAKTRAKALFVITKLIPIPRPLLFTGESACVELAEMIRNEGCQNVLVVTDAVLNKLGVVEQAIKPLKDLGVNYVIYDGVTPDPTFSVVNAGLKQSKSAGCDAVLAVGGGSVIDAAKMITMSQGNNCNPKKLIGFFKARKIGLPFYTIPTTAGTGSEATIGAVVSDDKTHQKSLAIDHKMVPRAAAIDPTIMQGMPPHITADTGIDVLTHALEAWMSVNATDETDYYAASAIKTVMEKLPVAYKNGSDLEAREALGVAAHYGGLALNKAGLGYVHAIAHQLGAYYGIPHGRANAIVLPYILDTNRIVSQKRLASLAKKIGLVDDVTASDKQLANDFISRVETLIKDIEIDPHVPDMDTKHFNGMAKAAAKEVSDTYAVPVYLDQEGVVSIIKKIQKASDNDSQLGEQVA